MDAGDITGESALRQGSLARIADEGLAKRRWLRVCDLGLDEVWRLRELRRSGTPGLEALDGVAVEGDHLLSRLSSE